MNDNHHTIEIETIEGPVILKSDGVLIACGTRPAHSPDIPFGGTIEYFRDTVFNYPTLAEAYKVAALNGLNKL
jgi:pyruvate/2-oxoglutarate dehydrogenase complex dihydrolipoamide dehydrogenase (E3) component